MMKLDEDGQEHSDSSIPDTVPPSRGRFNLGFFGGPAAVLFSSSLSESESESVSSSASLGVCCSSPSSSPSALKLRRWGLIFRREVGGVEQWGELRTSIRAIERQKKGGWGLGRSRRGQHGSKRLLGSLDVGKTFSLPTHIE
ncbi:UNVERIFIED_CONTAM: hypothetical protein Sangu_3114800 [Sesamum angustifolium]|uniref:Uncharacterized protein n=1 Tax=Sesamum angustifolium TaxID=2727405 RepID=A0AAW2K5N5_9LAMI